MKTIENTPFKLSNSVSRPLMYSLLCDFCSTDQRFARGLVGFPHPASFRFHLTMDTLAFFPLPGGFGMVWYKKS